MKNIILFILTITLFSCKSEKKNSEKEFIDSPIHSDSIVVIDPLEFNKNLKKTILDTIDVSNYNVVFFKPNLTEYNTLINKYGENSGLNEVDADFGFYLNKVFDSISKMGYKVKIVDEKIIKLSVNNRVKFINKIENKNGYYGIIFNNKNCEPKTYYGVKTDIEIFKELNDYFKNCK